MATSQQSIAAGARPQYAADRHAVTNAWARLLLPSFSDCFFIALFVWLFLSGPHGWESLLGDADIGWHIRTGDWILAHRAVPMQDLFSFSKPGAPWFAWEWMSDVIFALLFGAAGFKGVVLLAGVVIGLYATIVVKQAFWRGANALIALPIALLGIGSSTVHFLARPHVFTLLLLAVALWVIEADRRRKHWRVWLLIPLTALWVNLHGGFVMFLACVGLLTLGSAAEALLERDASCIPVRWSAVRRYAVLLAGCTCASFLNPYGLELHKHIAQYLQSSWIRDNIQEFQAPTFRNEGQLQFEVVLIIGLLTVTLLLRRRRITDALWMLFFAHSALTSLRHAPLFCLLAVPIVAEELSVVWTGMASRFHSRSLLATVQSLGVDVAGPFRRSSVWIGVTVAVTAVLPLSWPSDFPKQLFPVEVAARHEAVLANGRVLTTDQWGDYLIFHHYPRFKAYVDGRSDFYGEPLGREYLHVLQLAPDWQQIMERRGFDTVLLPPEWPIVQMLKQSAGWRVSEDTGKVVLLTRQPIPDQSHSPASASVLKKTRPEANEKLLPRRSLYRGDRGNERG